MDGQLLGVPFVLLLQSSVVDLTSLESTFTGHWQWKTTVPERGKKGYDCPWNRTYWKENVRTTYRVTQKAACQPRCADSRRTRGGVWWMSRCAKHRTALEATAAPGEAYSRASNRHTTLPFNDFLGVSALSFQAAPPLSPGCPSFAHPCRWQPRTEVPCVCPEFGSSPSAAALEALWGFGRRRRGCFQAGIGCPFPEESRAAVPCHC